jgi:predicted MFS family arabinose efflux permease
MDVSSSQGELKKNRWLIPVCLLTWIFFLNFSGRIILAPLLPAIERELQVSHGDAGSLFLSMSLGYFMALLGSGYVASRITHRQTLLLSAFMVGLTLIGTSFGAKLWQLHFGLLALGMAAGIYLPSGIATLTTLTRPEHWGRALSIHELAPNLSFLLAPFLAEFLMLAISWRGVLLVIGLGSLLTGIIYKRVGSGGDFPGQRPDIVSLRRIAGKWSFWGMMVLFALGVGSTIGIYTMLPVFLVEDAGMTRSAANVLVGFSRVATLAFVFIGGWATDRYGAKRTMGIVLFLTGILTAALGVLHGNWNILAIFLQPLVAVCFFPPAFAALSSVVATEFRNIIISLTVPFSFLIGGGLFPTVIGALGDLGHFRLAFSLTGIMITLGGVSALLFLPQEKNVAQ